MGDASDLHNFHNLDADRQQEVRAVMELTGAPEAENGTRGTPRRTLASWYSDDTSCES
jgi:hypothetical protein